MSIAEELFSYSHPFSVPDFFKQDHKIVKHEFDVDFEIIKIFSSLNISKEIDIQEYFHYYPSPLSNAQKSKIKQYFIQSLQKLNDVDLIEDSVQSLVTNKKIKISKLKNQDLNDGIRFFEKLKILKSKKKSPTE